MILMFTDDTEISRKISDEHDCLLVQQDLVWLMKLTISHQDVQCEPSTECTSDYVFNENKLSGYTK